MLSQHIWIYQMPMAGCRYLMWILSEIIEFLHVSSPFYELSLDTTHLFNSWKEFTWPLHKYLNLQNLSLECIFSWWGFDSYFISVYFLSSFSIRKRKNHRTFVYKIYGFSIGKHCVVTLIVNNRAQAFRFISTIFISEV